MFNTEWTDVIFGKKLTPFDFVFLFGYLMCFVTIVDQAKSGKRC
jgi:hypothetical protein